jgi:hypothetical protein
MRGSGWQLVVLTSTDPEAATATQVADSAAAAFVPKDQLPNAPLYALLTERAVARRQQKDRKDAKR